MYRVLYQVTDKSYPAENTWSLCACFSRLSHHTFTKESLNHIYIDIYNNKFNSVTTNKFINLVNAFTGKCISFYGENTLKVKPNTLLQAKVITTILRFLWETEKNDSQFSKIVEKSIELHKDYEIDEACALTLAHYVLDRSYNNGHSLFQVTGMTLGTNEQWREKMLLTVNSIHMNILFDTKLPDIGSETLESVIKSLNIKKR